VQVEPDEGGALRTLHPTAIYHRHAAERVVELTLDHVARVVID
jgi:hypothetical protein